MGGLWCNCVLEGKGSATCSRTLMGVNESQDRYPCQTAAAPESQNSRKALSHGPGTAIRQTGSAGCRVHGRRVSLAQRLLLFGPGLEFRIPVGLLGENHGGVGHEVAQRPRAPSPGTRGLFWPRHGRAIVLGGKWSFVFCGHDQHVSPPPPFRRRLHLPRRVWRRCRKKLLHGIVAGARINCT